jgi:hypothetical protein
LKSDAGNTADQSQDKDRRQTRQHGVPAAPLQDAIARADRTSQHRLPPDEPREIVTVTGLSTMTAKGTGLFAGRSENAVMLSVKQWLHLSNGRTISRPRGRINENGEYFYRVE